MTDKSPDQILLDAASQLENGEWGQGRFFNLQDHKVCMCAHGAIQYCGNNEVKERIDQNDSTRPASAAAATTPEAAAAEEVAETAAAKEDWIKYYQQHYPEYLNLFLAHYYANQAGLTYSYNDNPTRTKQEVIDKLREAAQLYLSENS